MSPVSDRPPACSPHGAGPQQTLLPVFGGEVGKKEGEELEPRESRPHFSPRSPLRSLPFSVSVWETETIGKRSPGEDRLLLICPSVHPAGVRL